MQGWQDIQNQPDAIYQLFQTFWHQRPVSGKKVFHRQGVWSWMIQVHYIYCALYFYYYYILIYNEIIIQLTTIQNQWEP